jgi:hypothetical protein
LPEHSGRELLEEWRQVMESLVSSAASRAGGSALPGDLMRAMQRQLELVQELLERESLPRALGTRLTAPVDAAFDLLEETGSTLRRQAEALEAAGRALEETAGLMKSQAALFERTVGALRQPADLAKAATGLGRRAPRKTGARKPRG